MPFSLPSACFHFRVFNLPNCNTAFWTWPSAKLNAAKMPFCWARRIGSTVTSLSHTHTLIQMIHFISFHHLELPLPLPAVDAFLATKWKMRPMRVSIVCAACSTTAMTCTSHHAQLPHPTTPPILCSSTDRECLLVVLHCYCNSNYAYSHSGFL